MLPTLSFVQPNHNVQDKRALFEKKEQFCLPRDDLVDDILLG